MSRLPRETSREEEGRKKRIPMNRPRFKLLYDKFKEPGFFYRVFSDDPGRLEAAQDAGYEFVTENTGKTQGEGAENERDMTTARVRRVVGHYADRTPKMGYLMRLPEEYRKEDLEERETVRKNQEKRILSGANPTGPEELDGRYIPEEGIHIDHYKVPVKQKL